MPFCKHSYAFRKHSRKHIYWSTVFSQSKEMLFRSPLLNQGRDKAKKSNLNKQFLTKHNKYLKNINICVQLTVYCILIEQQSLVFSVLLDFYLKYSTKYGSYQLFDFLSQRKTTSMPLFSLCEAWISQTKVASLAPVTAVCFLPLGGELYCVTKSTALCRNWDQGESALLRYNQPVRVLFLSIYPRWSIKKKKSEHRSGGCTIME